MNLPQFHCRRILETVKRLNQESGTGKVDTMIDGIRINPSIALVSEMNLKWCLWVVLG